jgi:hypothetical protein
MKCPECPMKPSPSIYWSYNMIDHWTNYHTNKEMPPELVQYLELTDEEREKVLRFKDGSAKIVGSKKRSRQASTSVEVD